MFYFYTDTAVKYQEWLCLEELMTCQMPQMTTWNQRYIFEKQEYIFNIKGTYLKIRGKFLKIKGIYLNIRGIYVKHTLHCLQYMVVSLFQGFIV